MLNIMVVDDSIIIRNSLKKTLSELGHKVIAEAGDGLEAIEKYSQCNPDLLTLDITMPNMTGIEALKEIKKRHPDLMAIMVTSHGEEKLVMDAIKSGAKGYVLKPITEEKVKLSIEKVFPDL